MKVPPTGPVSTNRERGHSGRTRGFSNDSLDRRVIFVTIGLGLTVAVTSVAIGYPISYVIHTLPRRLKLIVLGAIILPKLTNVFVVVYGLNLLLGHRGLVNTVMMTAGLTTEPIPLTHNIVGVLIAETYLVLPYAVLLLVPTFDRIDPRLIAAARGLGAGPWTAFRRVTFPLSVPGTLVCGLLCLIWGLGAFVGPAMLGGPEQQTLSVLVEKRGVEYGDWPRAAATAVVSLASVSICAMLYAGMSRVVDVDHHV